MTQQQYWNMVNNCETREDVAKTQKELNGSDLDCEVYNDMMMALSQISRELYRM